MILDGRDPEEFKKHVAVQAGIEIGFERFLEEKNYQAIVTHFGDLGSLKQLPGLAIQRLMEEGYGFGGEGDWKTAAMVRLMKIMAAGKKDARVLPLWRTTLITWYRVKRESLRHICWRFAHPLLMARSACVYARFPWEIVKILQDWYLLLRQVLESQHPWLTLVTVSVCLINEVECKKTEKPMPALPVGTAFWTPKPDLSTAAEAWILAGGAHHTAFTYDLTAEQMGDWAAAMGIEAVYIDGDTTIRNLQNELRWNSMYFSK